MFVEKRLRDYPYIASQERAEAITANYTKIRSGTEAPQVESMLGAPDEILPLHEPNPKNGKFVGFTYWYILRRATDSGSAEERDESLVRIAFDSEGKTTAIDRW